MNEAFDGLCFDDRFFLRESSTGFLIRGFVTSESVTITIGEYGPRGGWHPLGMGGVVGQLRFQRGLISEAIYFGEDLERRRKRWVADELASAER